MLCTVPIILKWITWSPPLNSKKYILPRRISLVMLSPMAGIIPQHATSYPLNIYQVRQCEPYACKLTLKHWNMNKVVSTLQTAFKLNFLDVESVNDHCYVHKGHSLSLRRIYASPVTNEFTYIHAVETVKNLSRSTMMVTLGTSIPLTALPSTCTRKIWFLRIYLFTLFQGSYRWRLDDIFRYRRR